MQPQTCFLYLVRINLVIECQDSVHSTGLSKNKARDLLLLKKIDEMGGSTQSPTQERREPQDVPNSRSESHEVLRCTEFRVCQRSSQFIGRSLSHDVCQSFPAREEERPIRSVFQDPIV